MSPTHALTIAQVAVRLRQGLRSRALVEEALELIDTGGGAYVSVAAARARADAADSDRRLAAGAPRSLLEGVPVSV
ncbi:MAG: amidase, partial [Alphaproteobacteria bacterium]